VSEPQDDPDPPTRPSPLRRASAGLHDSADGLSRWWSAARVRLRAWDERQRRPSFVSESETVRIDVRRHPFVLVLPALRTLTGLVVLGTGLRLWPLLGLALLTAIWATGRFRLPLRRTLTLAAVATVAVVVLALVLGTWWTALLLLGWLAEDVADWFFDRLVVTDRRIYRRYGVVTQHSPSIALTAIAYLDASVPPVGRLVGYGTLSLDSVAQRDAPLSRFDLVPDVVAVSHRILELRSKAMPKFPQQPL
jgi:Bacterial PH domain